MNVDVAIRRPSGWQLWWLAARPRTLTIAVAPVVAGTALAHSLGAPLRPLPVLLALAAAALIQAGTNLHNDVTDARKEADLPTRVGPPRVTAQGWATPGQVHDAALACFGLAALIGSGLAMMGGWPILVLGTVSLLAGWSYSGGPRPISYSPLGEAFVVAFFGIAAVAGSLWLQAPFPPSAWLHQAAVLGIVLGLPAAAVLMANNYRDAEPDRAAGRRTLAIVAGPDNSRRLYTAMMLAPFPLLALLPPGALVGLLALPPAVACVREFHRTPAGPAFNRILADTARCQLILAVATALGVAA